MKALTMFVGVGLAMTSCLVSAKKVYGDVQVTHIAPTENIKWQRENQHTPLYPIELARKGMRGCAVMSFDISSTGKVENIEVISSVPKKDVGKYSKQALKKWKWIPVEGIAQPSTEKRTMRLDYCISNGSAEQVEQACREQVKVNCR